MITRKHALLLGLRMTPMERAAGRFMRAPDHPEGETPPASGVEDDAFSAAFDEHTSETPPAPVDNGGSGGGGDAPTGDEPPTAATPPAGTPPAETPAAPPAGDPPADGATPPVTPPAAPPLSAEEAIARLADVLRPQAPEQPTPPAGGGEQPAEAPIYTPAELATIAEYEKNWPDVAAAERVVRRAEYHDLLKYVFTQVNQFIAPLQDTVRAMGNSLHTTELKGLVPDYTVDMEPQVNAWIDTQPDYLQAAMKQVMMTGTSDQMANLIGRFRAETGTPAPAPPAQAPSAPAAQVPAAAPAKPVKTELSSAAKQAAESLAPVSGTRTHVAAVDDVSQDFSTAFERFAVDN